MMRKLTNMMLLGTYLACSIAYVNAFDYADAAGSEDTSESTADDTPPTPAPKKAKKVVRNKPKPAYRAPPPRPVAVPAAHNQQIQSLRDQIRLLNEKLDRIEGSHGTHTGHHSGHPVPKGYFPIPGTNTSMRVGGYVKVDGIYDVNQSTGDASNLPNLRLRKLDIDAQRAATFHAHAKETRLIFSSITHTQIGRMMTYIEGDFFGTPSTSSNGNFAQSFSRQDNSSLNSHYFRIRRAYGKICNILVGQDWTTFYDLDTQGQTVEYHGSETTAQIRRPMVRYTHTHRRWRFSAALESGATEYLDISPSFSGISDPNFGTSLTAGSPATPPLSFYNSSQYRRAQSTFLGGITGDGNQALPDLVGQIRYVHPKVWHFALGLMGRQLKVKNLSTIDPATPFSAKIYAYGVAVSGRLFLHNRTNIFGQFNFGRGIGSYIFALDGYGAAFNGATGRMESQLAYSTLLGIQHYWTEKWHSNLIFAQARAKIAGFIPRGQPNVTGINTATGAEVQIPAPGYSIGYLFRQIYANLFWEPADKVFVGLEYAYFRRNTINGFYGVGNRIQMGAAYKF